MSTSIIPTASGSTPNTSQFDSQPRYQVSWHFWLQWTLATAAGWVLGAAVYSILIPVLAQASLFVWVILLGVLFAGTIAVAFGFTQGLVIRRIGLSSRKWILSSVTGGSIGGLLSTVAVVLVIILFTPIGRNLHIVYSPIFTLVTDALFLAMCGLITGASIGYRQRRALRDSSLGKLHWTTINALSWATGCAAIVPVSWLLLGNTLYPFFGIVGNNVIQSVTLNALCGLVGGAITGYPLMRALQQSPIQNPKSEIKDESSSSHVG